MAASEDGIQRLLKAEDEAAEIVKKARASRNQRLFAADAEAQKEIQQYRDELESKFQQETNTKEDAADDFTRHLKATTEAEQQKMRSLYDQNKTEVIQLMLHHVTSVDISVSAAQKQALAKYVGK